MSYKQTKLMAIAEENKPSWNTIFKPALNSHYLLVLLKKREIQLRLEDLNKSKIEIEPNLTFNKGILRNFLINPDRPINKEVLAKEELKRRTAQKIRSKKKLIEQKRQARKDKMIIVW